MKYTIKVNSGPISTFYKFLAIFFIYFAEVASFSFGFLCIIFYNYISSNHSILDKSLHGFHFWILYWFWLFNRAIYCSVFSFSSISCFKRLSSTNTSPTPSPSFAEIKKDLADILSEKILNFVSLFSKQSFLLKTTILFLLLKTLFLYSNSSCSKILYC